MDEAGQRLIEFCQENARVIANTLFQQRKRRLHMDITRWLTPKLDWLYYLQQKMEKLYTFSKTKTGNWLCQENALVITNTLFQQHKRRLYPWTSPDGQHRNQIDYILCSQRWRSSIQSAKTRLGADCDSDHELFIAKFRLKLNKIRKTTRPFRYDLYQIPYDYTVEVRNSFKWLDLINRVPNEL